MRAAALRTGLTMLVFACLVAVSRPGFAQPAVDANTATTVELDAIDGIGPALAARIVEERSRAAFRSLDDLRARVRGVGEANLRRMRDSGLVVGASAGAGGAETIVGEPADASSAVHRHRPGVASRQPASSRWPTTGTARIVELSDER